MSPVLETSSARWSLIDPDTSFDLFPEPDLFESIMREARYAKDNAYAPYSKFQVGAALVIGGRIYRGVNVENASYGATMCAERTALFNGVSDGERTLSLIAVTTSAEANSPIESRSPCGLCRQVMSEFTTSDALVLLDAGDEGGLMIGDIVPFSTLFPYQFRLREE